MAPCTPNKDWDQDSIHTSSESKVKFFYFSKTHSFEYCASEYTTCSSRP